MAAFIRHVLSTKNIQFLSNSEKITTIICCRKAHNHLKIRKSHPQYVKKVPYKDKATSLASRGFLRNIQPYSPPDDVSNRLLIIFENVAGTTDLNQTLNTEIKFSLLSVLEKEFSYYVPNSMLYKMKTLKNIHEFYSTPVESIVPYDKLKTMDLPPNLHVLYDYHRFHPDTDTMFNGVSAFPKSSTIVCGLTTKKKYKGYTANSPWDDI